ncbi:hypothetical protein DPEC_G00134380 [Dallia pectoralis]|uniref:Uncharacterized protein n=1 Tax=Dallia pectoralis TaxID=75939 RepID=A0ACC2GRR9_DALPE|nr:hypothetical protein DPEC_G00134380 [Dallia pectoralis]
MKWPKVGSSDPAALREFADFLQDALDDASCERTGHLGRWQRTIELLRKLPDWITKVEQSRHRQFGQIRDTDDRQPKRELEHFTNTKGTIAWKELRKDSVLSRAHPALSARAETHGVVKCPTFAAKSRKIRKPSYRRNNLCGCLKKRTSQ